MKRLNLSIAERKERLRVQQNIRNKRWRLKNKKKYLGRHTEIKKRAVAYKGGKCILCGYNKNFKKLAFHHIDKETKQFCIGKYNLIWERMKKELDKCVLVCLKCHSFLHSKNVRMPEKIGS